MRIIQNIHKPCYAEKESLIPNEKEENKKGRKSCNQKQ
jgi:hypothetical protein